MDRRHRAERVQTKPPSTRLIGALKDTDAGVRKQAAVALAQLRSPRAVPGLMEALKDPQTDVRLHAISALGEIEDREQLPR